jgi:hypothetical protein
VNPVTTFQDEVVELFDARLSAIIEFACRARRESAGVDDENQGVKSRRVALVKGTIDEDVIE